MTLFEPDEFTPAGPSGPLVRVRLLVAYDGGGFHGFAANPGVRTVGGTLAKALGQLLGHAVELTCAGRTDTGVHAWGQVVHFDTTAELGEKRGAGAPLSGTRSPRQSLQALQKSLNKLLGPAIVVRDAALAELSFDARRSATGRRYRYTVLNRAVPDPFLASTSWLVPGPLDLRAMELACDPLIGEHDFSAFCRRPPDKGTDEPLTRVVRRAGWTCGDDDRLRFDIEASAFCHQMVRSVVGTLVAVGRGRFKAGEVAGVIRARDRHRVPQPAPPHGLCLWEVLYDRPQAGPESVDDQDAPIDRADDE